VGEKINEWQFIVKAQKIASVRDINEI